MSTGLTSAGAVQWVGGSWVAVVTPRGVMLLPPTADDAVVTDLWELLRAEGTSMVDLMDALLSSSGGHIGSLPEFAAVLSGEAEVMHVMVRGRPVIFVDGTKLNCDGVETWYETTLESGQDIRVIAPEELHGRTRPVVDAIVSAAALLLGGGKIDDGIIPKAPEPVALAAEAKESAEAEHVEVADKAGAAEPLAKDEFLDAPVPAPALVEEHVPVADETIMAPQISLDEEPEATEVAEETSAVSAHSAADVEPVEAALSGEQIDEVDELSARAADAEQSAAEAEASAESSPSAESPKSAASADEAAVSAHSADEAEDKAEETDEADKPEVASPADAQAPAADEPEDQVEAPKADADEADRAEDLAAVETPEVDAVVAEAVETDKPTRGRGRFGKRVKAAAAAAAALVAHESAEAEAAEEAEDLAEFAAGKDEAEAPAAKAEETQADAEHDAEESDAVEAAEPTEAEASAEAVEDEPAAELAEEAAAFSKDQTPNAQFPDEEIEYEFELEPGMNVVDDFDEGEVRVVTPTAPAAQAEEPQDEESEEPQAADEDSEAVSSTIISHTVDQDLPQALLAELDAEFGVDLGAPSTDELYEDRYVLACPCPKGHANPTSRSKCRVCGEDLVLPAQRMVCPALGTVTMSSGEVISLDRDLVVGRQPDVTSFAMGDVPPLAVVVPSPERLISRNHVHIMLEEWAVLVEDLATRNGTILCRDGEDPVRMAPGTSVLIRNGDELVLGDGQSLVFEDLP
ncbi:Uncharacterised protein [Actinomyces bovis]|uniref:FHA domain-containing protein n=1 Tax=Actinomyces bovis TaxID=1658 RepID=A0ABY1VLZ9_9ACTO|nr:FHA domain-containing protein [Actinomyces bovis]SPT53115.1 Uncharacterised protein [Actinomyces bovis]VEG52252.1 Uncharacterised protein [Actinomyces israelii]